MRKNTCKHHPALAYIDAGTGALIFQAIAGLFLGGLFTLRLYWQKVKQVVGRWLGRNPASGEPRDPSS